MKLDINLRLAGMGALLRIGRKIMADVSALVDEIAGLKLDIEDLGATNGELIDTALKLADKIDALVEAQGPDVQPAIDAAKGEVAAARARIAELKAGAVAAEDLADDRLDAPPSE